MTGGNWIDGTDVGSTLKTEAGGIAARLGHRMTDFVAVPGKQRIYKARCVLCRDDVTVAVRRLDAAPIAGPAVAFRCPPRRASEPTRP